MKKSCQICQRTARTSSGIEGNRVGKVRLYRIRVEVMNTTQFIFVCSKCLRSHQLNDCTLNRYERAVSAT